MKTVAAATVKLPTKTAVTKPTVFEKRQESSKIDVVSKSEKTKQIPKLPLGVKSISDKSIDSLISAIAKTVELDSDKQEVSQEADKKLSPSEKKNSDETATGKTETDKMAADRISKDITVTDRTTTDKTATDKTVTDKTSADKTVTDESTPEQKLTNSDSQSNDKNTNRCT